MQPLTRAGFQAFRRHVRGQSSNTTVPWHGGDLGVKDWRRVIPGLSSRYHAKGERRHARHAMTVSREPYNTCNVYGRMCTEVVGTKLYPNFVLIRGSKITGWRDERIKARVLAPQRNKRKYWYNSGCHEPLFFLCLDALLPKHQNCPNCPNDLARVAPAHPALYWKRKKLLNCGICNGHVDCTRQWLNTTILWTIDNAW